jgi:hypothetical protein
MVGEEWEEILSASRPGGVDSHGYDGFNIMLCMRRLNNCVYMWTTLPGCLSVLTVPYSYRSEEPSPRHGCMNFTRLIRGLWLVGRKQATVMLLPCMHGYFVLDMGLTR